MAVALKLPVPLVRAAGLLLAVLAIRGYHAVGGAYYNGFWVPQGYGMDYVVVQELAHGALFVLFGLAAVAGLAVALEALHLSERDLHRLRRLTDPGRGVTIGLTLFVCLATWAIARYVLHHAVVTDDEHTYRFIAQTLRTGSLTAPSPGGDLDFFREQFVVLTDQVRYGKYPIGHPLLLALGQLLGAEPLVVPLVTALILLPLRAVGTAVFDRPTATLGLVLFALSPQVLLTGATVLSQPASALCLVGGLTCLLAAETRTRPAAWLAAAGACFGYGVLVRPLPGVLFVLVAAAHVVLTHRPAPSWRRTAGAWIAFGIPLAAFAVLMLVINRIQTGAALHTGYDASDAPGQGAAGMFARYDLGFYAMSVSGHLFRLNLWLFGWPLSLAFCAFARRNARTGLLWAMVGAAWAYRLIAPKSGVAATGPLYLFEAVPLLCLLTADGMGRLATACRLGSGALSSTKRAAVLLLAGTLVSLAMFVPVKLANLQQMADAQLVLPRMISAMGVRHALVFNDSAAPGWLGLTWAYFARDNSPRLDDDILFVRLKGAPKDLDQNLDFWRRRFSDRSAWYFGYVDHIPRLVPLESYLQLQRASLDARTASP